MPKPTSADATIQDWADYLEELLLRAKAATEKDDAKETKRVRDALYAFDEQSPKGATLLDQIANEAAVDLYEADLTARLKELKGRDQEFADVYALLTADAKK